MSIGSASFVVLIERRFASQIDDRAPKARRYFANCQARIIFSLVWDHPTINPIESETIRYKVGTRCSRIALWAASRGRCREIGSTKKPDEDFTVFCPFSAAMMLKGDTYSH